MQKQNERAWHANVKLKLWGNASDGATAWLMWQLLTVLICLAWVPDGTFCGSFDSWHRRPYWSSDVTVLWFVVLWGCLLWTISDASFVQFIMGTYHLVQFIIGKRIQFLFSVRVGSIIVPPSSALQHL